MRVELLSGSDWGGRCRCCGGFGLLLLCFRLRGSLDTITVQTAKAKTAELHLDSVDAADRRRKNDSLAVGVLEALLRARRGAGLLSTNVLGCDSVEAGWARVGRDRLRSSGSGCSRSDDCWVAGPSVAGWCRCGSWRFCLLLCYSRCLFWLRLWLQASSSLLLDFGWCGSVAECLDLCGCLWLCCGRLWGSRLCSWLWLGLLLWLLLGCGGWSRLWLLDRPDR